MYVHPVSSAKENYCVRGEEKSFEGELISLERVEKKVSVRELVQKYLQGSDSVGNPAKFLSATG